MKTSIGNFLHEAFVTEYAYQIVRDLDVSRGSYFQNNLDYKSQSTKSNPEQSQYKNNPSCSIQKEDDKGKRQLESVPWTNPHTQCYKCQGHGHVKKVCPSKSKAFYLGTPRSGTERHRRKLCTKATAGVTLMVLLNKGSV